MGSFKIGACEDGLELLLVALLNHTDWVLDSDAYHFLRVQVFKIFKLGGHCKFTSLVSELDSTTKDVHENLLEPLLVRLDQTAGMILISNCDFLEC